MGSQRPQVGAKLEPSWDQLGQVGAMLGQVGSSWGQVGAKLGQVDLSWRQVGPSWAQVGAKLAQDGPKMKQVGPKMSKKIKNRIGSGMLGPKTVLKVGEVDGGGGSP